MTTKTTNTPAISATVTRDGNGVAMGLTLVFADGRKLGMAGGDLNETLQYEGLWHGIKQKLVDAAAISRNPDTGRAASLDDKFQAVRDVYDRLRAGEWNKAREGVATGGLLLSALVRLYDGAKTREQIEAFLATKTDAEKTALRGNSKVAVHIEAIKAERAKNTGVDAGALLGELDAMGDE